jgi:hypothetical protein
MLILLIFEKLLLVVEEIAITGKIIFGKTSKNE